MNTETVLQPSIELEPTPAQVVFGRMLAMLQNADIPAVYKKKLEANLDALKPTLPSDDFERFVTYMRSYSTATAQLAEMEAQINDLLLDLIADKLAEYAALQLALADAETAAEAIARLHPEWFDRAKGRTVSTPYGKAKMHSSTVLEITDADATLALLDKPETAAKIMTLTGIPYVPATYRRNSPTLNLEALETLPDAALEALDAKRVSKDNFSLTAATVAMKQAVKSATKRAEAKGKEALA